ncbi:MAG: APC family permease [Ktedonobacterales bacterium]|nr:APC family permease [Ktedonobacterales bacterium]
MATTSVQFRKHLSVTDGFVLYTTAVLGQSLIVLPSIAARHAGPWSIAIWAALAAISYPMARVMAELGARYPSAGGVTAFIAQGLGVRVGQLTGVLYLTAMAVGAPSTALIFAEYLRKLTNLAPQWDIPVAGAELAVLVAINLFDVTAIMRWQRWVFFLCIAAVIGTIGLALPHVAPTRLIDVQGYGPTGIAASALIAFFAFVGWENAAFAGEEFTDPFTLVKSLRAAVLAVGALFLLLGVVVVGSLDRATVAASDASLVDLLRFAVGNAAAQVGALLAVVLIFLLMLTWTRSGGRLVVAMARGGLFPARLTRIHPASGTPRAALVALGGTWGIALAIYAFAGAHIETFIQLSSANFLATYVLIFVAAWRLLRGRTLRLSLIIASGAVAALVVVSLPSLWYAALTSLVFAIVAFVRQRHAAPPLHSHQ